MERTNSVFNREIKEHWKVQFTERGFPHVQQAWVLDPNRSKDWDPFILMAEDWFKRGTFSDHPHRGFQTITYVIDGRLEHKDNAGGHSILESGDVQYMNAGWAARHAEEAYEDDITHTLQLWLNLPKSLKKTETSYQDIRSEDAPKVYFEGGAIKVYSGEIAGVKGPMESLVPITMAELTFTAGTSYTYHLPENHNAFLYVLSGELEFGKDNMRLTAKSAATLTYNEHGDESKDSVLSINGLTRSKLLIYSGVPLKEEIATGGPFVMNLQGEIKQAYLDYQSGKFGPPVQ